MVKATQNNKTRRITPSEDEKTAAISDESLVQRLLKGEAQAGEELSRRYYEPLTRYLRRLVGNEHIAEEMHQQTWMSVLVHLEKFDPSSCRGGFKAWLFRIATNKVNDHWRSKGREKGAKEGLRLVTDEWMPQSSDRIEATEEQEKLRRMIDCLPENQRQVLMLRYYSQLKFTEIADAMGCPLNTALGRMHKAIIKLKKLMEESTQR